MKAIIRIIRVVLFSTLLLLVGRFEGLAQCTFGAQMITNGGFETGAALGSTPSSTTVYSPLLSSGEQVTQDASSVYCMHGGCFQSAALTAHSGSYGLLYDGGSTAGGLVCQDVTIDNSKIYDVSAFWVSAANSTTSIGNTADMRLSVTIGGVTTPIGPGYGPVTNQTSFLDNDCFFKFGGTGTQVVTFCVDFQPTSCCGSGFGSGNDVIVDDFSVKVINPVGTCSPTPNTCTYGVVTTPLRLISFSGERVYKNTNHIVWKSADEKDFNYFSIEKSEDGVTFGEIGVEKGTGGIIANYSYDDYNAYKSSYYRLRCVDLNGVYVYSRIINIDDGSTNNTCWLSFSEDGLVIHALAAESNEAWNISCYSLLGQEYFNENKNIQKGESTIHYRNPLFLNRKPKVVRIIDNKGKVIYSEVVLYQGGD